MPQPSVTDKMVWSRLLFLAKELNKIKDIILLETSQSNKATNIAGIQTIKKAEQFKTTKYLQILEQKSLF